MESLGDKVMEYVNGNEVTLEEAKHIWVEIPSLLKLCEHDTKFVL